MTDNSSKLETIQALRGVAAVLIVILHAFHEARLAEPTFSYRVGVDIFFVISGFIMVYTSRNVFGTPGAWKEFMGRRIIRIVPLCWFYTTLLVIVAMVMPDVLESAVPEPMHVILSYLFIPHPSPTGGLHPFLDVTWTLDYEMYFYAIFACFMFLPMRKMVIALSVYFIGSVIAGLYIPHADHALDFWTRPIVLEFIGGVWIAYLFLRGVRTPNWTGFLFLALGIAVMFVDYNPFEERPINLQLAAILFVVAAILPARMAQETVPRWFRELGDASYSIYLSHPFTLAALAIIGHTFLGPWTVFGLAIPLSLIAGYILYLIIEKPLLSLTKRVFLKHEKTVRSHG